MLKSITIQNVKGADNKTYTLDLHPNKPALLVAPNGFGKSSLATAFNSLKSNKIELHKNNFHCGDETKIPRLEVSYVADSVTQTVFATSNSNSISGVFGVFVINSLLKPKAVAGYDGRRATASLEIESITLVDTIPEAVDFDFSQSSAKTAWGSNSKILPNISPLFNNTAFLSGIDSYYDILKKLNGSTVKGDIARFRDSVNRLTGTAEVIVSQVVIPSIPHLKTISDFLKSLSTDFLCTDTELFIASIILGEYFNSNPNTFKKAVSYHCYLKDKESYEVLIDGLNSTWRDDIRPKKSGKSLVIEFPKAHFISNGQRDILCFSAMLIRARRKLNKPDNILIIDEVFDYLDDANLISAQYYVTKFIEEMKDSGKKIYPLLLTHINPAYFLNYAFKKPAIIYLDKSANYTPDSNFEKLLRLRNIKSDPLSGPLEKYYLHYHTGQFDHEQQFIGKLPQSWGRNSAEAFIGYVNQNKDNYLLNNINYDPLAVCCAVRRGIEERLFAFLTTAVTKHEFLENQHGTKKKLAYLESIGVDVPEYFYLLGIIYNDGLHWKDNVDNYSPVASKLNHTTIKYLIQKVFN